MATNFFRLLYFLERAIVTVVLLFDSSGSLWCLHWDIFGRKRFTGHVMSLGMCLQKERFYKYPGTFCHLEKSMSTASRPIKVQYIT